MHLHLDFHNTVDHLLLNFSLNDMSIILILSFPIIEVNELILQVDIKFDENLIIC